MRSFLSVLLLIAWARPALAIEKYRAAVIELIRNHHAGHIDPVVRGKVAAIIKEYAASDEADPSDVLFAIGSSIFGTPMPEIEKQHPVHDDDPPFKIVDFDYMKEFIRDVFVSYGVTPERAEICSDVLIESDKRGIDSHGLGRLKPIYCDRMDQGILFPNKPIDIVSESETTAMVDGNLGLGLYIGPYCMQMAIDKAKKYGVGFVVARRSTHYGIAGYYTGMAAEQGCVGFSGTNARPSIAPTFGAEPVSLFDESTLWLIRADKGQNSMANAFFYLLRCLGPIHCVLVCPLLTNFLSLSTVRRPSISVEKLNVTRAKASRRHRVL